MKIGCWMKSKLIQSIRILKEKIVLGVLKVEQWKKMGFYDGNSNGVRHQLGNDNRFGIGMNGVRGIGEGNGSVRVGSDHCGHGGSSHSGDNEFGASGDGGVGVDQIMVWMRDNVRGINGGGYSGGDGSRGEVSSTN